MNNLSSDYGVTLNENSTLSVMSDDTGLYDAVLDLVFFDTLAEETTFANTTYLRIQYLKPPCYVTQDDIFAELGGLSIDLVAERGQTDQVDLSSL